MFTRLKKWFFYKCVTHKLRKMGWKLDSNIHYWVNTKTKSLIPDNLFQKQPKINLDENCKVYIYGGWRWILEKIPNPDVLETILCIHSYYNQKNLLKLSIRHDLR